MMSRTKGKGSSTDEKDTAGELQETPAETEQPMQDTTTSSPKGEDAKKRRKRTKKAKGAPRRPLSAYNAFFKEQRTLILQERAERARSGLSSAQDSGDLFSSMGRQIAKAWKELTPTRMKKYKKIAEADMKRYQAEMEEYRLLQALYKVEGRQKASGSDNEEDRKPPAQVDPLSRNPSAATTTPVGTARIVNDPPAHSQKPLSQVVETGEQHLKFPAPAPVASAFAHLRQQSQQEPLDSTLALVREARAAAQRLRGEVQAHQTTLNTPPKQGFAASASSPMFLPEQQRRQQQQEYQEQQRQELAHPQSLPDLSSLHRMSAVANSTNTTPAPLTRRVEATDYLNFLQEQGQIRAALQERQEALERRQVLERWLSLQQQQQTQPQQQQQQQQPPPPSESPPSLDMQLVEWLRRRELQEALRAQLGHPGGFASLPPQPQTPPPMTTTASPAQQARASILEILRRDRAARQQQDEYEFLLRQQQQQQQQPPRRRSDGDDPTGGGDSGLS